MSNAIDLTEGLTAVFGTANPQIQAESPSLGELAEQKAIRDFTQAIKMAEAVRTGKENLTPPTCAIIQEMYAYNRYNDYAETAPETNKLLNQWAAAFEKEYGYLVEKINPLTMPITLSPASAPSHHQQDKPALS